MWVVDLILDMSSDCLSLTCRGHSMMLMSPLIPSGWNILCVAPVVKDNIAFLPFKERNATVIQNALKMLHNNVTEVLAEDRIDFYI